jgi:hypothetical protein
MKTKRWFGIFVCLWLVLLMAGCATVGKNFQSSAVREIEIGTTTTEDISNILGNPWRTGLENGKKTWTYGYYKYRLFGPTDTKDLVITFNKDNTVYSYSFNTTEAPNR